MDRAKDWPLDPFDAVSDAQAAKHKWADWLEQFEMVCETKAITSQREKFLLLMTRGGSQLHQIHKNQPVHEEEVTELGFIRQVIPEYENAVVRLNAYFNSKVNTRMEMEKFRDMVQKTDEDFTNFTLRLRAQANRCEFGVRTEDEILYQATRGAKDEKVRDKRIDVKMTLDQLVQYAIGREILAEQKRESKSVTTEWTAPQAEVGLVSHRWKSSGRRQDTREGRRENAYAAAGSSKNPCGNCGSRFHETGHRLCKARRDKCKNCNRIGHWGRMCRAGKSDSKASLNNVDQQWQDLTPKAEDVPNGEKVSGA